MLKGGGRVSRVRRKCQCKMVKGGIHLVQPCSPTAINQQTATTLVPLCCGFQTELSCLFLSSTYNEDVTRSKHKQEGTDNKQPTGKVTNKDTGNGYEGWTVETAKVKMFMFNWNMRGERERAEWWSKSPTPHTTASCSPLAPALLLLLCVEE